MSLVLKISHDKQQHTMDLKMFLFTIITLINLCFHVGSVQIPVGGRCFSPDEYPGECIDLDKCESLTVLRHKTPQSHHDRLYVSLSQCGLDNNKVLVCCTKSPYPFGNKPSVILDQSTRQPDIQSTINAATKKPPVPLSIRNPGENFECAGVLDNRIFGGSETRINEMPFTALFSYSRSGSFSRLAAMSGFFCGGALITEKSVLTVAHCVHEAVVKSKSWTLLGVRLGEWNLQTNPDCDDKDLCAPPVVDLTIAKTIVHESFVPFIVDQSNDIAIVKLGGTVQFSDFIKPICLPDSSSYLQDFDGVPLIVAGFGKTETGDHSNIKLRTEIRGISNAACRKLYDGLQHQIYPTQLCVLGDDGNDSCNGDSGQPLLYANARATPVRWELVGLTSYGPSSCGQSNKPGVYTRIGPFLHWIRKNMN